MENEIWKDVLDYEGLYQVSDLGRVKSLSKTWFTGNYKSLQNKDETIITLKLDKDGYQRLILLKDGKKSNKRVHRLVWESFNNKTDLPVDHINNIKTDNRLCNLQAITHRENTTKRSMYYKKSSIYTGVNFDKYSKKWKSQIIINGKHKHLGLFINELDASNAYQNALQNVRRS